MTCEKFNELLDNFENIDEVTRLEMNAHAAECESCRGELDFMLSIMATTKSLPKIEVPTDFMDNLNDRLDKVDRARIPMAIVRNIRTNWKQYATAAACFALVAVVTANSSMFVDQMAGDDTGVIIEDTVVSDNTDTVPVIAAATSEPVVENNTDVPVVADAPIQKKNEVSPETPTVQTADIKVTTQKKVSMSTAKPIQPTVNPVAVSTPPAEVAAEPTKADVEVKETETAAMPKSEDYGVAVASVEETVNPVARAYSLENEETAVAVAQAEYSVEEEYSLASEGSIAMGRYYRHDKNGNPILEDEPPKAIGNIKISSADAEKAMDVILQYTHGVKGDLYSTDSANLTLMLSSLSKKGVGYTNYIPAYEGEIKFKLVIS